MSQKTKARWKLVLNIVTLVALGLLIYFTREQIIESLQNFRKINSTVLLAMLVWQALNYHAYTKQTIYLFRLMGERLLYKPIFRVMLELTFVSHVFPSGGVSGLSYFTIRMKDADISAGKSSLVYLLRFILVFITFQVLLFFGLLTLAVDGRANGFVLLVGGSIATLIFFGTLFVGYIVGSKPRINTFFGSLTIGVNKLIHFVRPKHPETISVEKARHTFEELHENFMIIKKDYKFLKMPLLWSLVANMTEIMTIYVVYVAFGEWVNPGAVILAYAVANFAGLISVLPGGVGIYEALMTGVLAACGIPPGLSIPVTVMYRVLSMAIQLPPGYYSYQRNLHQAEA